MIAVEICPSKQAFGYLCIEVQYSLIHATLVLSVAQETHSLRVQTNVEYGNKEWTLRTHKSYGGYKSEENTRSFI